MMGSKTSTGLVRVFSGAGKFASADTPVSIEFLGHLGKAYARGLVGDQIAIPAGSYHVELTFPDGRKVSGGRDLEVEAGDDKSFEVLDIAEESFESAPDHFDATREVTASIWEDPSQEDVEVRLWRGNLLTDLMPPALPERTSDFAKNLAESVERNFKAATPLAMTDQFEIDASKHSSTGLILREGEQLSLYVVPFDKPFGVGARTRVSWSREGKAGARSLEYAFSSDRTNAFLSYVRHGERDVAQRLSQDVLAQAEGLTQGKTESPLGAVLGLYVLIRLNELEGVDEASANLLRSFAWIPDALAIRVELLARSGKHAAAVETLRSEGMREVPWFRSGTNYLLERIGLYLEIGEADRKEIGISPEDVLSLQQSQRELRMLCRYIVPSETVCVFRALPASSAVLESERPRDHLLKE
jgi:hypothetical protein